MGAPKTAWIRRSIKKHMPMGGPLSRGSNNPLTVHAVDDTLFACLWSLVAETMIAESSLSRRMKEQIASKVSEANDCPICVKVHDMIAEACLSAETKNDAAVRYALVVHSATLSGNPLDIDKDSSILTPQEKIEVALVVLLFQHMNRSASCLLGEEMGTSILGIPQAMSRSLEKGRSMKLLNKMMSPIIRKRVSANDARPGLTKSLFENEPEAAISLPMHLQGVQACGLERARAVARLMEWTETIYESSIAKHVPKTLLAAVDAQEEQDNTNLIANLQAVKRDLSKKFKPPQAATAIVLLLVTASPQSLKRCTQWIALVNRIGEEEARLLVLWYSMRHSLRRAQGLGKK